MRIIVQVAVAFLPEIRAADGTGIRDEAISVFAVCADGTLWESVNRGRWRLHPAVPDDAQLADKVRAGETLL